MLSAEWLDTLMQRMRLAYAGKFPPKGVTAFDIRAEWARELSGLTRENLKHAMANLPADWPPTAMQFRALALSKPTPTPLPPPGPAKVTAAPEVTQTLKTFSTEKNKAVALFNANNDPKGWARRLREREMKGEDLSRYLRQAWREALMFETKPETTGEQS